MYLLFIFCLSYLFTYVFILFIIAIMYVFIFFAWHRNTMNGDAVT